MMLSEASNLGIIKGVTLPRGGPVITHLLYADDVLLLGEWSHDNLILRIFNIISGLKVNSAKSSIFGIGMSEPEIHQFALNSGLHPGSMPFSYLGLQIGANMNISRNWNPVIEAFNKRLSRWKGKNLSMGGRLSLIQSVLSSLPLYYFSLFRAPKKVLDQLERIRRKLLSSGCKEGKNINWVKWEKVILPKQEGGLGIGSLKGANLALLARW